MTYKELKHKIKEEQKVLAQSIKEAKKLGRSQFRAEKSRKRFGLEPYYV